MREFDFSGRRLNVVAAQETADWLHREVRPNIAATFTLLQSRLVDSGRPSVRIWGDEIEYRWTYNTFIYDLSRECFGRAHRRYGKLVPHFATLEGDGNKRFHIHAAFRSPDHIPIDRFITKVHMHWGNSPWRMGDNKIEPIAGDWPSYILKEGSEALLSFGF